MKKLLLYIRHNWDKLLGVVLLLFIWWMYLSNASKPQDASVFYEADRCSSDGFGYTNCN